MNCDKQLAAGVATATPSTLADRISYLADRIRDEISTLEYTIDRVFGEGSSDTCSPTTGTAPTSLPMTADRLTYQIERLAKQNARLRELA